MLVQKLENTTLTNAQSTSFSVQSSGKMFKILMAGLYSNKAQSITREIWSNAYDAHKMVGKEDVPFEVVFPNTFREEFVVRDFGPGISHDDMQKLYTVLGYSSKENTNDAVGKWGVGRMSPMAYTDTFTVTSWNNGLKATYNVIFDGSGEPTLQTLLPPTPSDENSGLRISFPVSRFDVDMFQKAAKVVALGFDVKPVVIGNPDFDWEGLKITLEADGYRWYQPTYATSGPYAKMGCVLYPIDVYQIKDEKVSNFLSRASVIIDFPIGALEVTASREGLSYGANEPTVKAIEAQVNKIIDSLLEDVRKTVDSLDTPFEAFVYFNKACSSSSPVVSHLLKNSVTYKGQLIGQVFDLAGQWVDSSHVYNGKLQTQSRSNLNQHLALGVKVILTYGNDLKRVKDRVREYLKAQPKGTTALCCSQDTYSKIKHLFPVGMMLDLATVTPPKHTRGAKGVAQVRNLDNKPVYVGFGDGGLYIPWYNGTPDYAPNNLVHLARVVGLDEGLPIVMVPKTIRDKFQKSDLWQDLKTVVAKWVEDNKSGLIACAESVCLSLHTSGIEGKVKGKATKGLDDLKALSPAKYKGLHQDLVRRVLDQLGYTYTSGVAVGQKRQDQEVLHIQRAYPLLKGSLRYSVKEAQHYVDLVDKLSSLEEENVALKDQIKSLM